MVRLFLISVFWLVVNLGSGWADTLGIYIHRQPFLIEPILKAYTEKTGVTFQTVYAPKGLVQRLRAEGSRTRADLVLTEDISRIVELAQAGLLAPIASRTLNQQVPSHLRDAEDRWTALSLRARIIAISKDRVATGAISTIEELATPAWKGRVCSRKGSHIYNRALLASLIAHHGVDGAKNWAAGFVDNLARKPQGNDRAQAKAIFAGECDVALMNSYYYGKMKFSEDEPEQKLWADALEMTFFNQDGRGQHVNISAAGIIKGSKQKAMARAFLEWLTSEQAQAIYGAVNFEHPVNPLAPLSEELALWGEFKIDELPLNVIAENSATAQKIIHETGW